MKKVLSLCLVLVMVLSLAACGGNSAPAETKGSDAQTNAAETKPAETNAADTSAADDTQAPDAGETQAPAATGDTEEYIIGGMGPLTGSAASYGISVKQGAEVAINEINAAGGVVVDGKTYTFKLEFADDEASEDKAINAFYSLVDKKIQALVGATTSGASIAISDLTYEEGILQVTPSGSAIDCAKNPNAFRICFTDPLQGETMADFIYNDLGYTKVAVMYSNTSDYGVGIKDAFEAKFEELGGSIAASEAFGDNDVDFNTQLTKIKGTDAEAIFVPGYYQAATYITKQAADMGLELPFLGSDGWDGVLGTVTDASTVEGAIFLSPFFAADTNENVVKFVDAYKAAYNATPDQFAADSYDAVYVIKAAMEKAGSIESDAMIAAMTEISVAGLTGAGSEITFTAEGEPNKGAMFIQIKDGQYTDYKANK